MDAGQVFWDLPALEMLHCNLEVEELRPRLRSAADTFSALM